MVDRLERLVNLVIALRETRLALTTEQINEKVAGFAGDRDESWRRSFERDKADLRALGVPIRTEPVSRFDDSTGYRIAAEDYDLADVSLDPGEVTALALAVQLTGLGDDAVIALDKLAVGADAAGAQRPTRRLPLELGLDSPNRTVLTEALGLRQPVRFAYRKMADATPVKRVVEPHALEHRRGRWYLRGHDRLRDDARTFRLDRIEGKVKLAGEPNTVVIPPTPPGGWEVFADAVDAVDVQVDAHGDVAWRVARRARGAGQPSPDRDGWRRYTIRAADLQEVTGWLAELGAEVVVVGPDQAVQRMTAHLRAIIAAGTATPSGGGAS